MSLFHPDGSDEGLQDEINNHPQLAKGLAPLKQAKGVYIVEVLDALTGEPLGAQLVDTGGLGSIFTLGDRLIVADQGYMEIYSLATGVKEGEIFGWQRAYCKTINLISVREGNDNELAIYDLNSREKLDEFIFSSDVDFDQFSKDGNRLFVLTADQTAYSLNLSGSPRRRGDGP